LSKSLGFGKKLRELKAPADRARAAVTQHILSAIIKIESTTPSLANTYTTQFKPECSVGIQPEDDFARVTS